MKVLPGYVPITGTLPLTSDNRLRILKFDISIQFEPFLKLEILEIRPKANARARECYLKSVIFNKKIKFTFFSSNRLYDVSKYR